MREHEVSIPSAFGLAGVLCVPEDASGAPAMVLLGGAGADSRDGDLQPGWPAGTAGLPAPGTLRRIAHALAGAGVATLRWDRRGSGASAGDPAVADHDSDLEDALAAVAWLRARPEVNPARVAVAGHSAGAVTAAQVCRDDHDMAGAMLLAPPASPYGDILRWNLGRAGRHWDHFTPGQRQWLEANLAADLLRGDEVDRGIAAAEGGEPAVTLAGRGVAVELPTARLRQFLATDLAAEYRHVHCPALVLHGAEDLNVPVADALATYRVVHGAGNDDVELAILPGLDHYFHPVPADPALRVWNRVSLEYLLRPMSAHALGVVERWAVRVLRP